VTLILAGREVADENGHRRHGQGRSSYGVKLTHYSGERVRHRRRPGEIDARFLQRIKNHTGQIFLSGAALAEQSGYALVSRNGRSRHPLVRDCLTAIAVVAMRHFETLPLCNSTHRIVAYYVASQNWRCELRVLAFET
jgi:hypothetical protein